MSDENGDLELIEFADDDVVHRRRRRRRRQSKKLVAETVSASGILSAAALSAGDLGDIESSPASSVCPSSPADRKMSSLELDDISEEPAHMTSSTWTPGSLDSSRSVWELGSIEADEDEILSMSMSPVIPSLRMLQSMEEVSSSSTPSSSISSITAQIESILGSLKSDTRRLCVPVDQSNRLCIDPSIVPPQVREWFTSAKLSWDRFSDTIAAAMQPDNVDTLVANLISDRSDPRTIPSTSPTLVPQSRVPIINRKQRRAYDQQ